MNPKNVIGALVAIAVIGGAIWLTSGKSSPPAPVVSKEREHGEHAGEQHKVELSAAQIQSAGLATEKAESTTIREALSLYGVVAPNAERMRDVAARFPGVVRGVNKKIGDTVKQGETLALVEGNESLQTYPVAAPLSGVVTARNANTGEQTGEKVLFSVADLTTVWVELSLFPRDASKVRLGQAVRVTSSDGATKGEGSVSYIAPVGTAASQTRTARVLLDNKDGQWAPGLYVSAAVALSEVQVPLAVRADAIQIVEEKESVFVRSKDGFEPRAVRLGRTDEEFAEVLDGLKPGEVYATHNSFVLKAELGKGEAAHED